MPESFYAAVVYGFAAAAMGVVSTLIIQYFGRHQRAANVDLATEQAEQTEVETVRAVMAELRSEIGRLHDEVQDLRSENVKYRTENRRLQALVGALESELILLGGDPDRIHQAVIRRMETFPDAE